MVRPAMMYGLETVAVTKKQVEEMEVTEMKMLRFAMGVTRKDKIRNEYIRNTVKIERLGMKMREGRLRLRWYGHVMRRDQEYIGRKMMKMLRFAMGVTRKDKIRNEYIRNTVKIERLGMKMREGRLRLRWYGHVMRRDQEYVGRKMMEMKSPGKRRKGIPKKRFLDVVKEYMGKVGAKEWMLKTERFEE